jgi:hypothetical protein
MVKVVIDLNENLNEKLRLYINKKYPLKTYGKVKEVTEAAITEYLQYHPLEADPK